MFSTTVLMSTNKSYDVNQKKRWMSGRVFYFIAAVYVIACYLYDLSVVEYIKSLPEGESILDRLGATRYGGRWKYLTRINMKVQTIFYISAFIVYTFKLDQLKAGLHFLFKSVSFPIASLVSFTFWTVSFIDRDIICPKLYDEVIPALLNHIWHTIFVLLAILDALIVRRNQKSLSSSYWELLVQFFIVATYYIWVLWIKYKANFWVYPFLNLMTPFQVGLVTFFIFCLFLVFALVGHIILNIKWGEEDIVNDLLDSAYIL